MILSETLYYASLLMAAYLVYRVYSSSSVLLYEAAAKKRIIFALRITAVIILLMAFFDVKLSLPHRGVNYIVALDNSWSMKENVSKALKSSASFLDRVLSDKNSVAQYLSFGEKPSLEKININSERLFIRSPKSEIGGGATNLESALEFSSALASEESSNKIILYTDGEETSGNYKNSIGRLKALGIEVYPYRFARPVNADVILSSLAVPSSIVAGQKFEGSAVIELKGADSIKNSTLRIYRNDSLVANFKVDLNKGFNAFKFHDSVSDIGYSKYTAYVENPADKNAHNNTMHAYTDASGLPKILIVSDPDKGKIVSRLFSSQGFAVETTDPGSLPNSIEHLLQYRLVVLNDVDFFSLKKRAVASLKNYVADLGGGLLILGGDKSFGNGGYMATPLEELAPVTMDINDKAKIVSCAIIFVIDKSGSMSEITFGDESERLNKIGLAKEAVIASVGLLLPKDIAGVIAFDDAAKWIAAPVNASDRGDIIQKVSELVASGGTSMYGALEEAYKSVRELKVTTRHIVVLTDGITSVASFNELVSKFKNDKVTLSAVALGRDADVPFLQGLAKLGGGRFYFSEDASSLPSIFVQETLKSSRNLIVEEKFIPKLVNAFPLFNGFSDSDMASMPELKGYVASTIKPNATIYLKAKNNDPVVASMQCGLGKTAAATFDFYGRWGGDFTAWNKFPLFLKNTVKYILREEFSPNVSWSVERGAEKMKITFKTVNAGKQYINFLKSALSVTSPGGAQSTVEVVQSRAGTYTAEYKLGGEGTYFFSLNQSGGAGENYHTVFGYSYPYSNEYIDTGRGQAILSDIAASTGGRLISDADIEKWTTAGKNPDRKKSVGVRDYLIQLAIILFLLEIFLWRVDLSGGILTRIKSRAMEIFGASNEHAGLSEEPGRRGEVMGSLLNIKNKFKPGSFEKKSKDGAAEKASASETSGVSESVPAQIPPAPAGDKVSSDEERGQKPPDEPESFTKRLLKIKRK